MCFPLQRLSYFADLTNLLEWVLYVTSAVFIGPFFAGQAELWQWQCGAVAVFLAWFNLLLFLQRYIHKSVPSLLGLTGQQRLH